MEITAKDLLDTIEGLTPIVQKQLTKILDDLELGLTLTLACDGAGLSGALLSRFRKQHPILDQAIKMAKAKFAKNQLVYLNAAASIPEYWRAAQFLLQTHPEYKENTKTQQLITSSINEIRQSIEDGIISYEEVVKTFPASIASLVVPADKYAELSSSNEDEALSLLSFAND